MSSDPPSDWFVYLLACGDGSLYTGITTDLARRLEAHAQGRGARYTRGRGPLSLLGSLGPFTHGEALRVEAQLKRLTPAAKRARFGV